MKIAQVDIGGSFLGIGASTFLKEPTDLGKLVSIIVSNALIASGIILLFLLVVGGIGIIAAAGKGDEEGAAKGKKAATAAIIGFIIIFSSYWIVQIIQTITGIQIINP